MSSFYFPQLLTMRPRPSKTLRSDSPGGECTRIGGMGGGNGHESLSWWSVKLQQLQMPGHQPC